MKSYFLAIIAASVFAANRAAASPDTGAQAFTIESPGSSNRGDFVVGYRFALESGGTITALGVVDQNGDGKLNGAKPVKAALWTADGSELARGEIPLTTEAKGGVFYGEIAPLALGAGKYVIGALTEKEGESFWFDTIIKALPGVVWEEGLFLRGSELVMPTLQRPKAACYFGPVFKLAGGGVSASQISPRSSSLKVEAPGERAVFQRDEKNRGRLPVRCTVGAERVEVRAVDRQSQATVTDWTALEAKQPKEAFGLDLELPAGWYRLELRAKRGAEIVGAAVVERTGIGDMFVTAGQSNSANYGKPRQPAKDDRVSTCDFQTGQWRHCDDPQPGAGGGGGSPWPILGDLLVQKTGMPVGFICLGVGSTRVAQWSPPGGLYPKLKTALQLAGPKGCCAVLWHQGESDSIIGTSAKDYASALTQIIVQTRKDAGWDVPWGVALASYHPAAQATAERQQAIVAGQKQTIKGQPRVFRGPETDSNHLKGFLHDSVHFNADGLKAHAEGWAAALSAQAYCPHSK